MACSRELLDRIKANQEYYRARERCVKCGGQDAYTLGGRSMCADCAEKRRIIHQNYSNAHREKIREYNRRARAKLKAEGRCYTCGRLTGDGKTRCGLCREKDAELKRQKRAADGVNYPRGENGICWLCNKAPVVPGKRMCAVCMEGATKRARAIGKGNRNHVWRQYDHALFKRLPGTEKPGAGTEIRGSSDP